jgi:hypothetical protein
MVNLRPCVKQDMIYGFDDGLSRIIPLSATPYRVVGYQPFRTRRIKTCAFIIKARTLRFEKSTVINGDGMERVSQFNLSILNIETC